MLQNKRILLIDDDRDHLIICNILLRKAGYDVSVLPGCDKTEELEDLLDEFEPNLIFMDHDMRGICGTDLTRFIKSHPKHYAIPVIYFSGRDDIVSLAEQAGADSYFKKPFEHKGLLAVADKYLAHL